MLVYGTCTGCVYGWYLCMQAVKCPVVTYCLGSDIGKETAKKDDNKPKLLDQRQIIKQNYSHCAIQLSKIMRTGWHEQLKWSCRWGTTSIPSTQEAVFCHVSTRCFIFVTWNALVPKKIHRKIRIKKNKVKTCDILKLVFIWKVKKWLRLCTVGLCTIQRIQIQEFIRNQESEDNRDGQIFCQGEGKGKRIFWAPALLFVSDCSVIRSLVWQVPFPSPPGFFCSLQGNRAWGKPIESERKNSNFYVRGISTCSNYCLDWHIFYVNLLLF